MVLRTGGQGRQGAPTQLLGTATGMPLAVASVDCGRWDIRGLGVAVPSPGHAGAARRRTRHSCHHSPAKEWKRRGSVGRAAANVHVNVRAPDTRALASPGVKKKSGHRYVVQVATSRPSSWALCRGAPSTSAVTMVASNRNHTLPATLRAACCVDGTYSAGRRLCPPARPPACGSTSRYLQSPAKTIGGWSRHSCSCSAMFEFEHRRRNLYFLSTHRPRQRAHGCRRLALWCVYV